MRRRLDLAASLIVKPKILFLDEPTTGLDPRGRIEMWEVIQGLVKDGTTLLLTTQYLEEADQLANEIAVIDHGKVSGGKVLVEEGSRQVSAPVTTGSRALIEAVRSLDELGIHPLDIALKRPSLDDVFIALTGHVAEENKPEEGEVKSRRGRRK